MRLTELAIRKLPYLETGQRTYWDASTPGFGLRVGARTKSYVVMFGERRKLKTLGHFPRKSLSEARTEAKRYLTRAHNQNASMPYSEACEEFLRESRTKNREKTVSEYERYLKMLVFAGDIDEIKRSHLSDILKNTHALVVFKLFFNWCVRNELRSTNPLHADRPRYNVARERILTDDELKAVWSALEDDRFSTIVRLLILTGQRRSEIEHFILDGDTITIPGEHTKNRKTHTFPIGPLTKQHYRAVTFNGWSKAKKQLDERCPLPHWTLHDLRRTFASNHAKLGTPIHVIEKLLNHSSGSMAGVAGIYNRHTYMQEMREACDVYEKWLASLL